MSRVICVCLVFSSLGLGITASLFCKDTELVTYTVVFVANWSRELFPKQYPEWRPPAQWSRIVGQTHNADHRLFQLGGQATPELKIFAETGKQEILGNERTNNKILDEFLLPAIKNGTGVVRGRFIVNDNYSRVSLAARVVPSPDWFVGIDSLDLCTDGHWVDTVTVEASPIDAGTDSGFTFTAPNWSTEPQEPIYKITAQYPRHPANSFYYPDLQDLPPIAKFIITKNEAYCLIKDLVNRQPVQNQEKNLTTNSHSELENNNTPQSDFSETEINSALLRKHIKRKAQKSKRSKFHGTKKCIVGEWSDWTACNAQCGQSERRRKVVKAGSSCPPLVQKRTCGCTKYVFNW